jgi:hypothetical protein
MTTRIGTGGPATGVLASASATRVTAPPGQPFKSVMSAGASAILSGAEQAVTRLPGGPILAAALRPAAGAAPIAPAAAAQLGGIAADPLAPEGASAAATEAGQASPSGQATMEAALSDGANQNLFFIKLQERINAESRDYSAWSNILKARHDTVKNAIGNIR